MKSKLLLILFILGFCYTQYIMLDRISPNTRAVIWSDAEGYYKYLPGLFIIKDFHQLPAGSVWPYVNDKGEYVDKYSCGVAYFELPFFLVGHLINQIKGGEQAADYYNPNYAKAIAVGGVTATFLGLLFLFLALRRDFSEWISIWTLFSVFLGTNLFHYTTKEMGISHVYSFFLFSFLIFHLPRFLKDPGFRNSILLGGTLGWLFLIRPTNAIVFLFLLGYQVYAIPELKTRIQFYLSNYKSLLWIALTAFLFLIPQFLYWKEMTGHWIYYSYTDETFKYWSQPKIAAVLFDVQNGLFLYSPLALLMMAGMVYGWIVKKYHAPVMLLIFAVATYAFASWWAWWFGGAFGHRCYVEYYALFVIPLAGLYEKVWSSKSSLVRYSFLVLTIALMIFSVRLSYLYTSIGGPWDGPDWRWNWDKYKWILDNFF